MYDIISDKYLVYRMRCQSTRTLVFSMIVKLSSNCQSTKIIKAVSVSVSGSEEKDYKRFRSINSGIVLTRL